MVVFLKSGGQKIRRFCFFTTLSFGDEPNGGKLYKYTKIYILMNMYKISPHPNPPPWGRALLLLSNNEIYNNGRGLFFT